MITNSAAMLTKVMPQTGEVMYSGKTSEKNNSDFETLFSNVNISNDMTMENVEPKTESKSVDLEVENSKMSKDGKNIETSTDVTIDNDKVKETVEELANDIKETVKEIFDISDEELEEALESLGLTLMDLLNPSNVMQLMMQLSQNDNPLEIITDANMSEMFKNLNAKLEELVSQTATELNITDEEVVGLLQEFEEVLMEQNIESTQEFEGVIQDNKLQMVEKDDNFENTKEEENSQNTDDGKTETTDSANSVLTKLNETVRDTFAIKGNQIQGVDVENIVRQINEAIKVNMTGGATSMELQLMPENLGKINIQVVAKDGIITASITATEETVKNALETQMISLKETLNNQGIKVDEVEVTIASHSFEQQEESSAKSNNEEKANDRKSGRIVNFDEETDEEINDNVMVSANSTIDYQA